MNAHSPLALTVSPVASRLISPPQPSDQGSQLMADAVLASGPGPLRFRKGPAGVSVYLNDWAIAVIRPRRSPGGSRITSYEVRWRLRSGSYPRGVHMQSLSSAIDAVSVEMTRKARVFAPVALTEAE